MHTPIAVSSPSHKKSVLLMQGYSNHPPKEWLYVNLVAHVSVVQRLRGLLKPQRAGQRCYTAFPMEILAIEPRLLFLDQLARGISDPANNCRCPV